MPLHAFRETLTNEPGAKDYTPYGWFRAGYETAQRMGNMPDPGAPEVNPESMTAQQDGGVIYIHDGKYFRHGIIDTDPQEYCVTYVGMIEHRCTCGKYLLRDKRRVLQR